MGRDECRCTHYKELITFIEHRRPSKFVDSELGMRNWWKQQQKLLNAGGLKPESVELFKKRLERGEYKHASQYY